MDIGWLPLLLIATDGNYYVMTVSYDGDVSIYSDGSTVLGVRPLVRLKSGVKLSTSNAGSYNYGLTQ